MSNLLGWNILNRYLNRPLVSIRFENQERNKLKEKCAGSIDFRLIQLSHFCDIHKTTCVLRLILKYYTIT